MFVKAVEDGGPLAPQLFHCIYSSVASSSFQEHDLPGLLLQARKSNAALQVTGMLAYINGNFLQVLEGEEAALDALFEKISKDPRHKRVLLMIKEPIAVRSFAEWSMGFEALLPAETTPLVGENDFFDGNSCLATLAPGLVKSIFTSFRDIQAG